MLVRLQDISAGAYIEKEKRTMSEHAFQDAYPDELSHCYGCGRLNPDGLQLKSYWDGDETVARFRPRPSHMAIPGYIYGGLPGTPGSLPPSDK